MSSSYTRPSPEELLRRVEAEEAHLRRGRLKVFLGYASGVGKSERMFDEGRRRRERGQDVVVAALQTEIPSELQPILKKLDVIPFRVVDGVATMDVDAILRRHPEVVLVDGLAYDNPPGSRHARRWEDVEELLQAGIAVITSINLQYVAEKADDVERIRGTRVKTTVPESFLRTADEIELVDAPAEYCIQQAAAGKTSASPSELELQLSQLRELALLLAADVVDHQLESYTDRQGAAQAWSAQERILVCLTPKANARRMIERSQLARDRFHGELFATYVGQPDLSADDQAALERNLAMARGAGARVRLLEGEDAVAAIIQFAREHRITQIYVGHSPPQGWWARMKKTFVDRLIQAAEGIDVKLFPQA
jgi:two-component system sensor histidine kinase KdpD